MKYERYVPPHPHRNFNQNYNRPTSFLLSLSHQI